MFATYWQCELFVTCLETVQSPCSLFALSGSVRETSLTPGPPQAIPRTGYLERLRHHLATATIATPSSDQRGPGMGRSVVVVGGRRRDRGRSSYPRTRELLVGRRGNANAPRRSLHGPEASRTVPLAPGCRRRRWHRPKRRSLATSDHRIRRNKCRRPAGRRTRCRQCRARGRHAIRDRREATTQEQRHNRVGRNCFRCRWPTPSQRPH